MLADDLSAPVERIPLAALADRWQTARLEARLAGYGALADDLVLMNRVRGAFGRRLMDGASDEAIAGKPCPWHPPSALDVLFREQMRVGRHGLPKPLALALDRRERDLVVRLTLFGLAIDWAAAAMQAMVSALRHDIDWRSRADGRFLPKLDIVDCMILPAGLHPSAPRSPVVLRFVTPLDSSGDDPLERPATVVGRLARRVDLMARWMGVELDADWPALSRVWLGLDYNADRLARAAALARHSSRTGQSFRQSLVAGELAIVGALETIWPLLAAGESCHVGRGATQGLGRYVLE